MSNIQGASISGVVAATGTITGTVDKGGGAAPVLENISVKSADTQQVVTASAGYDGIGEVTVEALTLQDEVVAPASQEQVVYPAEGYDALGSVTVDGAPLQSKSVTPGATAQTVTADIGYYGLESVTVGAASSDNLPAVAFDTLRTVTINAPDAQHKEFTGFFNIESLTLPDATKIGQHVFENANIESVSAPLCEEIDDSAFSGAHNLQTINFPAVETIKDYAFMNVNSLSGNISFPNLVYCGSVLITGSAITGFSAPELLHEPIAAGETANGPASMLAWNTSLVSVNLPKLQKVGSSAFDGCTHLASLTLPAVTEIGSYAFDNCGSLEGVVSGDFTLYLPGNTVVTAVDDQIFGDFSGNNVFVTVRVPSSLRSAYVADTNWAAMVAAGIQIKNIVS